MPLRFGVHKELEAAADELLRQSMAGVTQHTAKRDVLTNWKQKDRWNREVYVGSGIPDPATRRGMFHRMANTTRPDLNSREGIASSDREAARDRDRSLAHSSMHRSRTFGPWDSLMEEYGGQGFDSA